MNAHLRSLLSTGGLVAAFMFPAVPAFAASLDYTSIPDNDPGNTQRGEFLGPFSARIIIEGLGTYTFGNPISGITERTAGLGFQPVESKATFGGGSTSSMTGFSPDTITPFFGDPNVLNPFSGGANVVVADFNSESVMALGSTDVLSLSGQSPGGTVKATTIAETGSTLVMFGMVVLGLAACRGGAETLVTLRRNPAG